MSRQVRLVAGLLGGSVLAMGAALAAGLPIGPLTTGLVMISAGLWLIALALGGRQ